MTLLAPLVKSRPVAEVRTEVRLPFSSGVNYTVMPGLRGSQIAITVEPLPGEKIGEMFGRLSATIRELEATVLHLLVFGSVSGSSAATEAMRRTFGGLDWPVTWVEGAACDGSPIAGLQAFAFVGGEVQRIRLGGRVVGSMFEDGAFRHCLLGGVGPEQKNSPRAEQTKQTLGHLADALAQGGFSFADVMRTWFFLDDMLAWYDEFNRARTQIYSGIKFKTGSLPASTGIGGRNPAAAALVAGAWAARPLSANAHVKEAASPLQCPAPAYGSSFSRAMELSSPTGQRLFISGTASISPDGRTLWQEDTRRQVAQTMQVVEAILESRGLSWSDLTRATAYFKRAADVRIFHEWCAEKGLIFIPVILANSDVCRNDLLFELELDAWRSNQIC
ncbi:MAG: Rid family hydrolase [Limisphaerales bacterium]